MKNIYFIRFNYMNSWWGENPWLCKGNFAVIVAEEQDQAITILKETFDVKETIDLEVSILGNATPESESELICGNCN